MTAISIHGVQRPWQTGRALLEEYGIENTRGQIRTDWIWVTAILMVEWKRRFPFQNLIPSHAHRRNRGIKFLRNGKVCVGQGVQFFRVFSAWPSEENNGRCPDGPYFFVEQSGIFLQQIRGFNREAALFLQHNKVPFSPM